MRPATKISVSWLVVSAAISSAYGHMAIIKMYGESNGITGKGFGIIDGTPRDSATRDPGQLDSPFVRDFEIQEGIASTCGRTLLQGKLDIDKQMEKAEDGGLPNVGPQGVIRVIAHQVNSDGAGPYTCGIDTEAKAVNFQNIPVSVQVPGDNSKSNSKASDFTLEARMPQGTKCTGGSDGQTCILRCLNSADAGPYGGCIAFTQKEGLINDPSPGGNGPSKGFQLDKITENPVTREGDLFSDMRSKLNVQQIAPPGGNPTPQTAQRQAAPGKAKARRRDLTSRLVMNSMRRRSNQPSSSYKSTPSTLLKRTPQAIPGRPKNSGSSTTSSLTAIPTGRTGGAGGGGIGGSSVTSQNRSTQSTTPGTINRSTSGNTTPIPQTGRNTNGGGNNNQVGHVDPIRPTEEGIMYEIATGALGQADTPPNVRQSLMGKKRSLSRRQAAQFVPVQSSQSSPQQKVPSSVSSLGSSSSFNTTVLGSQNSTNSRFGITNSTTLQTAPKPTGPVKADPSTNPLSLNNAQIAQAEAEEKAEDDAENAGRKPRTGRF